MIIASHCSRGAKTVVAHSEILLSLHSSNPSILITARWSAFLLSLCRLPPKATHDPRRIVDEPSPTFHPLELLVLVSQFVF